MRTEARSKPETAPVSSISQPCVIAVSHHLPLKIVKERVEVLLEYFRRDPASGKLKTHDHVHWKKDLASTELRLGLELVATCNVKIGPHWVRLAVPQATPGNTKDKISTDLTTILCCDPNVSATAALWRCHHDRAAKAVTGHS